MDHETLTPTERGLIDLAMGVVSAVTLCVVVDSKQMVKLNKVTDQVATRTAVITSNLIARWKGEPDKASHIIKKIMLAAKSYAEDACGVPRFNGSESGSEIKFDD